MFFRYPATPPTYSSARRSRTSATRACRATRPAFRLKLPSTNRGQFPVPVPRLYDDDVIVIAVTNRDRQVFECVDEALAAHALPRFPRRCRCRRHRRRNLQCKISLKCRACRSAVRSESIGGCVCIPSGETCRPTRRRTPSRTARWSPPPTTNTKSSRPADSLAA